MEKTRFFLRGLKKLKVHAKVKHSNFLIALGVDVEALCLLLLLLEWLGRLDLLLYWLRLGVLLLEGLAVENSGSSFSSSSSG